MSFKSGRATAADGREIDVAGSDCLCFSLFECEFKVSV